MCGLFFAANMASSQTTILSETFEGGSGTSLSGWTFANGSQTNKWCVGTGTYYAGSRSAYITSSSPSSSSAYAYNNSSRSVVHLYRDITVSSTVSDATLTFYYQVAGESGYDYLRVFLASASTTPAAGTPLSSTALGEFNGSTTWQRASINLPAFSGTMRLIFSWINDNSVGNNPPIAIDNIQITSSTSSGPSSSSSASSFVETFESGSGTSLANWTFVNGNQTNKWYVGTSTSNSGSRSAYVSSGTTYAYNNTAASTVHLYRNVNAAPDGATLTFYYMGTGEGNYDYLEVFLVSASTTIAAGTQLSSSNRLGRYNNASVWRQVSINLPAFSVDSRLVFSWQNDGSQGTQPIAIDDIVYKAVVTPKAIQISGATIAAKAYDGATTATVTGVTFSGLPSGATLTLGTDYTATATFGDATVGTGKTVTVTVTLTEAATESYTLTGTTYQLTGQTIGKRNITIDGAAIDAKTYDGTIDATVTGVVFSDLPSGVTLAPGTDYTATAAFGDATVGTGKTATVTVRLTGDAAATYNLTSTTYQLAGQTIGKRDISIDGAAIDAKTYDGTIDAIVTGVSFSELPDGVTLALGTDYTATAAFGDATVGTGKTVTVTVTLTGAAATYNLTGTTYQLDGQTIGIRNIAIDSATIAAKTYDGTTTATVTGVSFSELPDGVSLALGTDYTATADFDDASADGDKTVTITATLQGVAATQYTLTGTHLLTGQAIAPRSVEISEVKIAPSKVYDGTDDIEVEEVTFTDPESGEPVELVKEKDYTATATFESKNVGSDKTINAEVTLSNNYMLNTNAIPAALTGSITRRQIAIETVFVAQKYYDGTTNATVDSVRFGKVNGDPNSGPAEGEPLTPGKDYTTTAYYDSPNVGDNKKVTVAVSFNSESNNYELIGTNQYTIENQSIEKAAPKKEDFLYDLTPVIYNGEEQVVEVKPEENLSYSVMDYTVRYNNSAVKPSNAGSYEVTLSVEGNDNVNDTTLTLGMFVIEPKNITITSVSIEDKIYDGTDAATVSSVTFDGLGNEQLIKNKDYTASATFDSKDAGENKTASGTVTLLSNVTNYTLGDSTFTRSNLAISKRQIGIDTAFVAEKYYNGDIDATIDSIRFSGLAEGETLILSQDYKASAYFNTSGAGSGKTVILSVALTSSQEGNGKNYTFADNKTGTNYTLQNQVILKPELGKANLTFSLDTLTYTGDPQSVSVSLIAGYTGQEIITVTYNDSDALPTDAGEYEVKVSITGNDNFNDDTITLGTLVILKKEVSIESFSIESKTYDGTTDARVSSVTFGGLVNEESLAAEEDYTATAQFASKNAGTHELTATVTLTGDATSRNYYLAGDTLTQSVSIAKRPIYFDTAFVAPKDYDSTTVAEVDSVRFIEIVLGETLAIGTDYAVDSAAFDNPCPGNTRTVSLKVALVEESEAAKNYEFANGSYTLTNQAIQKREPTMEDITYTLPSAITYDGEKHSVVVTLKNGTGNGYVEVTYNDITEAPASAGSYEVKARVVGDNNFNDVTILELGTLVIVPDTIYIEEVFIQEKVYDGTNSATVDSVSFTGVAGVKPQIGTDYTATAAVDDDINAGSNKSFTSEVTVSNNNYYLLGSANWTKYGDIAKRKIAIDTAFVQQKEFDGIRRADVDSVRFGAVDTLPNSGPVNNETFTLYIDYNISDANFDSIYAGDRTVTMTVTLNGNSLLYRNYELVDGNSHLLTGQSIKKATLTERRLNHDLYDNDRSLPYNGTERPITVSVKNGDSPEDSIVVLYNGETTPPVGVGDYNVTADISNCRNYNDTTGIVLGVLKITPLAVSIDSVFVGKKVYDGKLSATVDSVTFTGIMEGEELVINENYTATATFDGKNAGPHVLTTTVELTDGSNYTLSNGTKTQSGSIAKRPIAVDSAQIAPRTYDGKTMAGVFEVLFKGVDSLPESGYVKPDEFVKSFQYDVSDAKFTDANAGEGNKIVTMNVFLLNNDEMAKNYELLNGEEFKLGGQSIEKEKINPQYHLTYTPKNTTVSYNGEPQIVTVALKSAYTGMDNITVKYDGSTTPPSAVGTYPITADIAGSQNFLDTSGFEVCTLYIVEGYIKIDTAFIKEKSYDGTLTAEVDNVRFTDANGKVQNLTLGKEYTASAEFDTTGISSGRTVTVTVSITPGCGYLLKGDSTLTIYNQSIIKATPKPEHFEFYLGGESGKKVDTLIYDGEQYSFSHQTVDNERSVQVRVKDEYKDVGIKILNAWYTSQEDNLVAAGTYLVYVMTAETETCYGVTKLSLNPIVIDKATPRVEDITFNPVKDTVYTGNPIKFDTTGLNWAIADNTAGKIDKTTITYTDLSTGTSSTTAPKAAGSYAISVNITESKN
ncbi:MAG: YDG domain-containing protein, partial [Prevotellaceae bacterium]|nr:YDG domain-containing protein [Prevotellaceae bacterium]